jgi:hypothetical protein
MLVVEHPALAKILRIAFMKVWEEGLTFDEAAAQAAVVAA